MTFKSQLTADLASVFFNTDEFAESVTYTRDGYFPETISIIRDSEDETSQDPEALGDEMIILALASEVSAPGNGDTYTIDEETWYHREVLSGPIDGQYKILLSRAQWRQVR